MTDRTGQVWEIHPRTMTSGSGKKRRLRRPTRVILVCAEALEWGGGDPAIFHPTMDLETGDPSSLLERFPGQWESKSNMRRIL